MALDPSKGRDARYGDYSAIVMLGIDPAGSVYIDAELARKDRGGVARSRRDRICNTDR